MRQPPGRQDNTSVTEREVNSSNATLNAFIGGSRNARQKPWMTGQAPVRPTPRRVPSSTQHGQTSPGAPSSAHGQTSPSAPSSAYGQISPSARSSINGQTSLSTLPSTNGQIPPRPPPSTHEQHSPSASTSTSGQIQPIARYRQQSIINQSSALPSPVPSDELYSTTLGRPWVDEAGASHGEERSSESVNNMPIVPAADSREDNSESLNNGDVVQTLLEEPAPEDRRNNTIGAVPLVDLLQSPSPEPMGTSLGVERPTSSVQSAHAVAYQQRAQIAQNAQRLAQLNTQSTQSLPASPHIAFQSIPQASRNLGFGSEQHPETQGSHNQSPRTFRNPESMRPHTTLIDQYLSGLGGEAKLPSDLERARFRLLRSACEQEDAFYLAAHQLFCAWDTDEGRVILSSSSLPISLPPVPVLQAAFTHLGSLLRPNSFLAPAHHRWFSTFPNPLMNLFIQTGTYQGTMQAVANSLARIAEDFAQLSNDALARNYPPLVEELISRLGVTSPNLQWIIFTAARRNLGADDDVVGQDMERLFREDQRESRSAAVRANTNRPLMTQEMEERKRRLANAYSHLLARNSQRRRSSAPQTSTEVQPLRANSRPNSRQSLQQRSQVPPGISTTSSVTANAISSASASPDLNAATGAINLNSPSLGISPIMRMAPRLSSSVTRRTSQTSTPSPRMRQDSTLPSTTPQLQGAAAQFHAPQQHQLPQFQDPSMVGSTTPTIPLAQQRQNMLAQLRQVQRELHHIDLQCQRLAPGQIPGSLLLQQQAHSQQQVALQQTLLYMDRQLVVNSQDESRHIQNYHPGMVLPSPASQQVNVVQASRSNSVPGQVVNPQQANLYHRHSFHVSNQTNSPGPPASGQTNPHEMVRPARNGSSANVQNGSPLIGQNHSPSLDAQSHTPYGPRTVSGSVPSTSSYAQHPNPVVTPMMASSLQLYHNAPVLERSMIPPLGFVHPPFGPNPETVAVHQAHLRSPNLVTKEVFPSEMSKTDPGRRFYQVVTGFAITPLKLAAAQPVTMLKFSISPADFQLLGRSQFVERGQPENREFHCGTIQYRMRCVKKKQSSQIRCGEAEWVVSDTSWPDSIVFQVYTRNTPQQIEIRRKNHHGKDLPVDLTPYVRCHSPGEEIQITISFPSRRTCLRESSYFFAVEKIEISAHKQILSSVQRHRRQAQNTLDALKKSLASPEVNDDEIALVSNEVTIDIADPFSSRMFEVPVRGNDCLHRECFDLETFLLSRTSKPNRLNQPSMVDVWKCPLCNRDARPMSLHVDDFLVNVRKDLIEQNLPDVKAIIINKEGQWKPKPLPEPTSTNGKRKSTNDESDSEDDIPEERKRRIKSISARAAPVVIDLSD